MNVKNLKKYLPILMVVLLIASLWVVWLIFSKNDVVNSSEGASIRTVSIPGFEKVTMKANRTEQIVYLYNPKQNDCYFVISLIIDEKILFTSDLIRPGEKIAKITLEEPLSEGTYSKAILQYSCYDLYDINKELNGANITIELEVEK